MFSVRRPGNWGEVKELLTSLPDDGAMLMEHIYASHMVFVAFLKTAQGYFFVATYLKNSYMSYREWDWLQCYLCWYYMDFHPWGLKTFPLKITSPLLLVFFSIVLYTQVKESDKYADLISEEFLGHRWISLEGHHPKTPSKLLQGLFLWLHFIWTDFVRAG